jgi:VWFA-related protein
MGRHSEGVRLPAPEESGTQAVREILPGFSFEGTLRMTSKKGLRGASLGVAVLTLTLAAGALASAQEEPVPPSFPSEVELVTVDAVVLDDDGKPVRGLTRDDFLVFEDGRPQEIASFEAFDLGARLETEAGPTIRSPVASNTRPAGAGARAFFLLVDDLGLAPSRLTFLQDSVRRFLATGLYDGDEVTLATSSGEIWWSTRMPAGRDDVEALLRRVQGRHLPDSAPDWMSDWEAYRIEDFDDGSTMSRVTRRFLDRGVCMVVGGRSGGTTSGDSLCAALIRGRARELSDQRRNRARATVAAIEGAIFALAPVRGRKSLLLFSEGLLDDQFVRTLHEVRGTCLEANVAVYFLDVRGLQATTGQVDASAPGPPPPVQELILSRLEQTQFVAEGSVALAEDTGGFAVTNSNDLARGATRVADESRVYYLLAYALPPGKRPQDWRDLKVQVKKPGLRVRARKGYTLRKAAGSLALVAGEGGERVPAEVARALANAHAADGIGLRAMVYVVEPRPEGTIRVALVTEIDASSLSFPDLGGQSVARLALDVVATHRDSGRSQRYADRLELPGSADPGWPSLSREFDLPPGVSQARVVVRDETSGRLGAVTVRFEVPPAGGLWIATPLLSERRTAAGPVRVAHREFPAEGSVHCQLTAFGVTTDTGPSGLETHYELRGPDGTVLVRGSPDRIDAGSSGRWTGSFELQLSGLSVGPHLLVAEVREVDTGQTHQVTEPLWVLPGTTPPPFSASGAPSLEAYRTLLAHYRAGERESAITTLAKWPRHASLETLFEDEVEATTAAVLHTETALAQLAEIARQSQFNQPWRLARAYNEIVSDRLVIAEEQIEKRRRWPSGEGLYRDWLLAVGTGLQVYGLPFMEVSRGFLETCRRHFPGDAAPRLALGSLHEMGSLLRQQYRDEDSRPPYQMEEGMARRAEKEYREALEIDPELPEAHLRLGRLLARRGRRDEAERELLKVLGQKGSNDTFRALAHLFLGDQRERSGKAQEALFHYQEAIRTAPQSRTSYVALSHALHDQGHEAAAREAAVLAATVQPTDQMDLWIEYHFAPTRAAEALTALRQRVAP